MILSNFSLLEYKKKFMKHGICKICDFSLIKTREELNHILKDMNLPLLVERKFIQLAMKYIKIDNYEGIDHEY